MNFMKSAVATVGSKVDEITGKDEKKDRAGPGGKKKHNSKLNPSEYAANSAKAIPADVRMFSGCKDSQTSADVSNVASFGLPKVEGAESAGGACTNALLSIHAQNPNLTYGKQLEEMQKLLKYKKYTQVPQLSSSRPVNLKEEVFSLKNPQSNGRFKALLIGINYYGQNGELKGCVNDVKMMKRFVESQGFVASQGTMQILTDDPQFANAPPTRKNISEAIKWLVTGAQPGDSLFFHYSGHGGQLPDDDGDEDDGYDETLIPVDYASAGQIRDDEIFKTLVTPLPQGAQLVAVFDCCHSGTILDLPYMFAASDANVAAMEAGKVDQTPENPFFNLDYALKAITEAISGIADNATRALDGVLKKK